MGKLFVFLANELKLIYRDKRALALLFLMPALLVLILSSILTHLYKNQRPQLRILVMSSHQSTVGDGLVKALHDSGQTVEFSKEIPTRAQERFDLLIRVPVNLPQLLREVPNPPATEKVEFVFYK